MSPIDVEREFARFVRSGDPAALGAVYDALAPELLRVALHFSESGAEAEDLLQSTFVTAIERAASHDPGRPVKAWLVGILAHHARNARRRAARAPEAERVGRLSEPSPIAEAHGKELEEALDRALADLPEAFRPVLVLRLKHGLTTTEIAEVLARPSGTVRSQLARGLEEIRRALPASLVGTLATVFANPARGLDVVRGAVLAHAVAHAHVAGSISIVGGVFAMSKATVTATAVAAVALVAALWLLIPSRVETPPPRESTARAASDVAEGAAPAPPSLAAVEREVPSTPAVHSLSPPAPPPSAFLGRLELAITYEPDGAPASNAVAVVRLTNSLLPYPDEREVVADAFGHAALDDLPPGSVVATGVIGGQATGAVSAGATTRLRLAIPSGARIEGDVVDEHGNGVGQARVWLSEPHLSWKGRFVCAVDEKGKFELRSVGAGRWIGAKGPGRAVSYLQPVDAPAGATQKLRIVLDRAGATVRGRVIERGGGLVAGARVLVGWERDSFDRQLDTGLSAPSGAAQVVVSDAEGAFTVDGVPLGRCPVQARGPRLAPAWEWLDVAPGTNDVVLELSRDGGVFGVVGDARGEPVPFAMVTASHVDVVTLSPPARPGMTWVSPADPTNFATSVAFADARGRYDLRGIPAGDVALRVIAVGLHRVEETIRLVSGERREWNPSVDSGPTIRGRVVDENGSPLFGWGVISRLEDDPLDPGGTTSTDARGTFAIEASPDRVHHVTVFEPGGWNGFPRVFRDGVRAGGEPLLLEVKDDADTSARLVGSVVRADGSPATDAKMILWHEERRLWRTFDVDAENGQFEIAHVPLGTVRIDVRAPSRPWLGLGARAVAAGERVDLGVLRIADGVRLRARLVNASDEGLEKLQAFITGSDNRLAGTLERSGHTLVSGPLVPGAYFLVVRADALADETRAFEIDGAADVEIDVLLRQAGTRRVVIDIADGVAALQWVSCLVIETSGRAVCVRSETAVGVRRVEMIVSIPPGPHLVRAMTDTGLAAEASIVQTTVDREDDVALRLGP